LPVWSAAALARRIEAQRAGTLAQFAAWVDDRPIGRAHVLFPGASEWSISAHREQCAEVRDVFVAPEHRRRGVATALMDVLERIVLERGSRRIGLSVATDEHSLAARALYQRLGYRFAHGPYIGGVTLRGDEGLVQFAAVVNYLVKEL
jgi:GNAT superfamily N-acetyltransferase